MAEQHDYAVTVTWTGNTGSGTADYTSYSRDHTVEVPGKPVLHGSADPAFRGDAHRMNPEDLLVASLSQCHMLWYLGLCAASGVVVTEYRDVARGAMTEERDGAGRFTEVVLRPEITVADESMRSRAISLHRQAHRKCFIANSVNFPVRHEPAVRVAG
ncbi:OsmC family protein [Saccharopolyspora rosea]|uniref:OsmC family protein n=1 Tax=Saccharopolyspora rosea TaxID=524884 RepID=A0ABW3FYW6_9PSEU|nr:OsmC family protein [Saccharopolyspora rosea]